MELSSADPFNYKLELGSVSVFETVDEREIPAQKPPSNILQQMHQEFRRNMGVIREAFGADGPWPGYEIEDDEDTLFEEEIAQKAKEEREAKASEKPAEKQPEKAQAASPTDAKADQAPAPEKSQE